jgi:Bacterial SH3 domain
MSKQIIRLSFLIIFLTAILFAGVSAQSTKWRYVGTISEGVKMYLKDEVSKLKNRHLSVWDKRVNPDNSYVVSKVEWDCKNKRSLTRQMTLYNSDQKLLGTTKDFEWQYIIPDSVGEIILRQICFKKTKLQYAEIIAVKANLRAFANKDADVIRIVKNGTRFIVVEGTGKGGWYNVVDEKTQQDYWVHGNTIKIIP